MNKLKYTTKITLYNSYFDYNDNLSYKSILNIFQDVASIHAEEIGVGYEAMLNKNLYWVLSRIKIDILKMPKPNETVIVETWPHVKGRIDFDRDFKILNEKDETLIIGTSKWCIIDTVNRMLQRTDNINYNGECIEDKNYEDSFTKIDLPDIEETFKFNYKVRHSALDHNQHMNNTYYANLVFNAVENKLFRHFEINFKNECILNDEISVFSIQDKDGEYVIGKSNDKTYFIAYVK